MVAQWFCVDSDMNHVAHDTAGQLIKLAIK